MHRGVHVKRCITVQCTEFNSAPALGPAADTVRVGVGATGAESLAALIAAQLPGAAGDDEQERLQTAFAYGVLDTLDDPDGIPRLEAELHALDASVGLGVRLRRQVGVDPQRRPRHDAE